MDTTWQSKGIPNPGSDEAIALSCLCPIIANNHGHQGLGREGLLLGGWWITENCPLHDVREKEEEAQNAPH